MRIRRERLKEYPGNVDIRGRHVLYWMQRSMRARFNHALEFAIDQANSMGLPLLVLFCLTPDYPMANLRHYKFMLEGLMETARHIRERGAGFLMALTDPVSGVVTMAKDAPVVVTDTAHTKVPRQWRQQVKERIGSPFIEVETDMVVPAWIVSDGEEYAAWTIRKKINRIRENFLTLPDEESLKVQWKGLWQDPGLEMMDPRDIDGTLNRLGIDTSVLPVEETLGGTSQALACLGEFIENRLDGYEDNRNDPNIEGTSNLSPYLHFGNISPVEVAIAVQDSGSPGIGAFLEELIVRRELAINFTSYNQNYDDFSCLPRWCRDTINSHRKDPREYDYTLEEWERAGTHDPYWNAAQKELLITGRIHGYMRMYWGKKILEWTREPEEAYRIAVYLNDRYQLDGRDPNGYAGVAWCFGKHDRPWAQRNVFGTVRYMNDRGLRRKFDADAYVKRMDQLFRDFRSV